MYVISWLLRAARRKSARAFRAACQAIQFFVIEHRRGLAHLSAVDVRDS